MKGRNGILLFVPQDKGYGNINSEIVCLVTGRKTAR
jgi:hypothetical protein